jgi:hypothetical protein
LGAIFAAQIVADRALDQRLRLGDARPRTIRFETEAPIDDFLIETSEAGCIFVQAKTSVSFRENLDSEFGKIAQQIVRQWSICTSGKGERGWDRPLDPGRDRILIVVGPSAAATISNDLATGLESLRALSAAPLPAVQQQATRKLADILTSAWAKIFGGIPSAEDVKAMLRLITVLRFDVAGADRSAAIETLAHIVDATQAPGAFDTIAGECERLMAARQGTDAAELRRVLARARLQVRSPPSFQSDVAKLQAYSARVQSHLIQYEETRVAGVQIKIKRKCTEAVVAAAKDGSLVLVGEPGAGKSAVVSAAAEKLRSAGNEVIELAVDRLPVDSLDGLRTELELTHPLRTVLANWPGSEPAYLFIDALDATRGGRSEAVFRTVIQDALSLPDQRWRIVASIRAFDLRLGDQFRKLFQGTPPDSRYTDPTFSSVRHLNIPSWTVEELAELLTKAPAIATAIERGGRRLEELALIPFNTRLLADLLTDGMAADAFGDVGSQVELLGLYWGHRVASHGPGAELCLKSAVAEMVTGRILRARRLETAEHDPAAFQNLLHENVLVTLASNRYVAFRHHILFDYAASRLFIDPSNLAETSELLRADQSLGLMLAPALSFALQDLWVHSAGGRRDFWQAIIQFAGSSGANPIARSIAARVACELPQTSEDMSGLGGLFTQSVPESALAFKAFAHIVGALTVRIEDKQPVSSSHGVRSPPQQVFKFQTLFGRCERSSFNWSSERQSLTSRHFWAGRHAQF